MSLSVASPGPKTKPSTILPALPVAVLSRTSLPVPTNTRMPNTELLALLSRKVLSLAATLQAMLAPRTLVKGKLQVKRNSVKIVLIYYLDHIPISGQHSFKIGPKKGIEDN